jgi:hypothetical protein
MIKYGGGAAIISGGAKVVTDLSNISKSVSQANHTFQKAMKMTNGKPSRKVTMAPVSINKKFINRAPRTTHRVGGGVRIVNDELINGTINGSTSFTVQNSYYIQPGDATTFPWLSVQAAQYEQYKIHKLEFVYIPSINTSASGDVMLLADYNVSDPVPTSEAIAIDHPYCVLGSVWDPITFRCDISKMSPLGPRKFVRTVSVAGDQKTFDGGRFHICTNNGSAVAIGKLLVHYDIEFFVPQLNPLSYLLPTLTSRFYLDATQTLPDNAPTNVLWNYTGSTLPALDPLRFAFSSGVIKNAAWTQTTPPAGCYLIEALCNFADATNEVDSVQLYFVKNSAQYPTNTARFKAQAQCGINTELVWRDIISFNGTDTFEVIVLSNWILGAGTLESAVLTVRLA